MPTPTTQLSVTRYLGLPDDTIDTGLAGVVDSVNVLVAGWRPLADPDELAYPTPVQQGATMLAARVWRRRNSPAGVESYGDLGPTYVQRNDPDVAMLLGLGYYTVPVVG